MAQTSQQIQDSARALARKIFVEANAIANLNHDDLVAAYQYIDTKMDALASTFTQNQSIKINLAANLPEPFKTNATVEQKGFLVAYWAMKEVGLI